MIQTNNTYITISTQTTNIKNKPNIIKPNYSLKKINPTHYKILKHPNNTYSFNIFTQINHLIKSTQPNNLLNPLTTKQIITINKSQSTTFLITYINTINPITKTYNNYLIHSQLNNITNLNNKIKLNNPQTPTINIHYHTNLKIPILNFITKNNLIKIPNITNYHITQQTNNQQLHT